MEHSQRKCSTPRAFRAQCRMVIQGEEDQDRKNNIHNDPSGVHNNPLIDFRSIVDCSASNSGNMLGKPCTLELPTLFLSYFFTLSLSRHESVVSRDHPVSPPLPALRILIESLDHDQQHSCILSTPLYNVSPLLASSRFQRGRKIMPQRTAFVRF